MRILPILSLLLLSSCLTDSRINKQIAKATPERVLGLIQKNYPHLFNEMSDTLRDTVYIKKVKVDTAFKFTELRFTDTVTIEKERVKTKIWFKHDTVHVVSECKADTVYVEKVVKSVEPKKDYYQSRWWVVPMGFLALLLVVIIIAIIAYWADGKMKEKYIKKQGE